MNYITTYLLRTVYALPMWAILSLLSIHDIWTAPYVGKILVFVPLSITLLYIVCFIILRGIKTNRKYISDAQKNWIKQSKFKIIVEDIFATTLFILYCTFGAIGYYWIALYFGIVLNVCMVAAIKELVYAIRLRVLIGKRFN